MKNYFWVARDNDSNHLAIFNKKPKRDEYGNWWPVDEDGFEYCNEFMEIDSKLFPKLKVGDKPIKVKLVQI